MGKSKDNSGSSSSGKMLGGKYYSDEEYSKALSEAVKSAESGKYKESGQLKTKSSKSTKSNTKQKYKSKTAGTTETKPIKVNTSKILADTASGKSEEAETEQKTQTKYTDEANNGTRRSNNEYQKKKTYSEEANEQKKNIYSGNQEDADMDAAWANLEGKKNRNETQTAKDQKRANAKIYTDEADRLEQEKRSKYGVETDLFYNANQNEIDEYDRQIAENRAKAKAELADINTTSKERDAILDDYLKSVENERTVTANATDLNRAEAEAATADRKAKENALKDINRLLGNDVYYGLVDEAQGRDIVEGWQGERQGQYGAAIGTGLEWLGNKINNTSIGVENPDTGEVRELMNFGGKGDALEQFGSDIFQNSKAVVQTAQEDWDTGTSTMSDFGKSAAGVGKTVANTLEDMVANFMLPGAGSKLMALRVAGAGALEQDQREGHNDLDSRATKALLDGGAALLSNWAIGGVSAAYGKSALGKAIGEWANAKGLSPMMQRALNTEGIEEVGELGIGYIGDRVLGLVDKGDSFWSDWSWREAAQEYAVGYFLGFLLNAGAGGQEVDAARAARAADESVEFGERVVKGEITPDEAIEIALSNPNENAKMTGQQKAAPKATAEQQTAQRTNTVAENGWTWDNWVQDTLSGGELSDVDINEIVNHEAGRQAFENVTGISLEGMTEEEAKATVGMAAGSTAVTGTNTTGEPVVNTEQTTETPGPAKVTYENPGKYDPNTANFIDKHGDEVVAGAKNNPGVTRLFGTDYQFQAKSDGSFVVSIMDETGHIAAEGTFDNRDDALAYLYNKSQNPYADYDPTRLTESTPEPGQNTEENNASGINPDQEAPGNENTQGNPKAKQNPNTSNENPGQNGTGVNYNPNAPGYIDSATTGSGPEQVSEHFTRTLTKREGEDVRSPTTYLKKSDAEKLENAMSRLNLNREAETQVLMSTTMWTDEQVEMAKIISNELLSDARKSGDYAAYDAWREIESEHKRAIARALRSGAEDGKGKTEDTRSLSMRYLDMLASAQNDPHNTGPKVDPAVIEKARQTVNDVSTKISALEAEEADFVKQGMSEEEAFNKVKDRYLDLAQQLVAERNMGLLWDNILGRNQALRDGNTDVQTRLRKMLAKEDPEYIRQYCRANNAGVATDVEYKSRPTVKQAASMISSMQSMCMLFGSGTFLRNTESNIVFGTLGAVANNTFNVGADLLLSAATGQRTRGFGVGALSKSGWQAFSQAGRRSVLEIAANMDMKEDGKYISSTQTFSPYNPVTRVFARINQALSYSLNTSDAVIEGMTKNTAEKAAIRVGEKSGMTEETAAEIGQQNTEYATFKNNTAITKFLEGVQNAFDLIGFGGEYVTFNGTNIIRGRKGGMGIGTLLAKYVKVPANIKAKPLEFSPIGAAVGAVNAGRAIKMAKNSSPNSQARQDSMVLQNKASGQIGRGVTGTALIFAIAMLMKAAKEEGKEWFRDWDQEKNKNIKAQNKSEGKSGQQVNLSMLGLMGDQEGAENWGTGVNAVDISSNEPMNAFLTMAAALADDEDFISIEDYADALYTGVSENLLDMPCVETFSVFQDNIEYGKVYETTYEEDEEGNIVENREVDKGATILNAAGAAAGSAVSGFVPAPVRHIAQVQDEYKRDTKGKTSSETAWNQVVSNIPTFEIGGKTYGRGSLPIKTDAFGNPVTQGDLGTRVANTYLANKYSQISQTPVSEEVNRLYQETGESIMPASSGPKTITYGSGKDKRTVELTADESREIKDRTGQAFERQFGDIMNREFYDLVDADTQNAIGKEIQKMENDAVKDAVAKQNGIEFESKYEDIRELENPAEALAVQKAYNSEKKDENWSAVEDLLDVIRGKSRDTKISQDSMDYLVSKDSKINYYSYLGDKGVPLQRAKDFEADLKQVYEGEERADPRASDYIRVAGSGKYSDKEADAIMGYEREVSKESLDRYQRQVKYQLGQAGKSDLNDEIWRRIELVANGKQDKDVFRNWIRNTAKDPKNRSGIPAKQGEEIIDIMENYASDNHVAGVYVTAFYNAARSIGCTPQQALEFYEHIDNNYNKSYSKTEIDAAVAWAFGYDSKYTYKAYGKKYTGYNFSGNAKKVRDSIREATGR